VTWRIVRSGRRRGTRNIHSADERPEDASEDVRTDRCNHAGADVTDVDVAATDEMVQVRGAGTPSTRARSAYSGETMVIETTVSANTEVIVEPRPAL